MSKRVYSIGGSARDWARSYTNGIKEEIAAILEILPNILTMSQAEVWAMQEVTLDVLRTHVVSASQQFDDLCELKVRMTKVRRSFLDEYGPILVQLADLIGIPEDEIVGDED